MAFVGPEPHVTIAMGAGKAHAGREQTFSQPPPPRVRCQQEQAELCSRFSRGDTKDTAKARATLLREDRER